MSKRRWIAPWLLLAALGCIPKNTSSGRAPPRPDAETEPAAYPTEVVEALAALDVPCPPRGHINDSPVPTKSFLRRDCYDDCPDAIDLLSQTPYDIDPDLLRLAQSDKPWPARYRAGFVLTHRKNLAVIPVLERMCAAQDDEERFVAWGAYREALENKQLPPPSDSRAVLALYQKERDGEVHEQIAWFLGTAGSAEAVPVLMETLRGNPSDCPAIWALGLIGDARAVPAVIAAFGEGKWNRHYHCKALGRLATPEAVDFLIAHLDEGGAVEALAETRSPKALPALRRHLDKLTRAGQHKELDFALATVAVTELSHKNPALPLLALAEERGNSDWLRHHALDTLAKYNDAAFYPRLLRLFGDDDDPDPFVKRDCASLLADSSLEGVTEALVKRAANSDPEIGDHQEQALQAGLLTVLNKRLGYSYRSFKALHDHLASRRSKPIGAGP